MALERGTRGQFLPGNKEASGKRTSVSLVRTMKEDLEAHPDKIFPIWDNLYNLSIKPDFRALEAIDKILDRIDGKTPSEVNLRALVVHVGDDYAREGIEAVKRELLESQERYLLKEGEDATK